MGSERNDGENSAKGLGNLGSLAQSARLKHLNTARATLIAVGILTLLVNAFLLVNARQELQNEIRKQGMAVVNPAEFETALLIVRFVYVVPLVLGVIFVILGLIVKMYPVPITIVSLVLYVLATLGFAILDPMTLAQGILFKIIIIVVLAKAIQAAFAYQRDVNETLYEPE